MMKTQFRKDLRRAVLTVALALLVIVALALFLERVTPAHATEEIASGTCGKDGDNLTWTLTDDGTLTIEGEGEMENFYLDKGQSDNPWYKMRMRIREAVIGEGITNVGDSAFFECGRLQKITIPNSVTRIGHDAFYDCPNLTEVSIPDCVTTIEPFAFSGCTVLPRLTSRTVRRTSTPTHFSVARI